jgi:HAMP domain-containing protein
MEALDRWLDRAYARLGHRLLTGYVAFGWACGTVMAVVMLVAYGRLERLSGGDALRLAAYAAVVIAVGLPLGIGGSQRLIRPLRALEFARAGAPDDRSWRSALRIPIVVSAWNCLVAVVWLIPAMIVAMGAVVQLDGALVAQIVLGGVCGLSLAGAAGVFCGQIVMRPAMRALGQAPAGVAPPIAAPVRLKLLISVPAITTSAAGLGVLLGAQPGIDHTRLLERTLLAMGGALLVAGPVALLLATSLLRPLDDLLHATRRLAADDFSAPVPELSADEYGLLARSFNEAMAGLAQRQALSAENARLLHEVVASRAHRERVRQRAAADRAQHPRRRAATAPRRRARAPDAGGGRREARRRRRGRARRGDPRHGEARAGRASRAGARAPPVDPG